MGESKRNKGNGKNGETDLDIVKSHYFHQLSKGIVLNYPELKKFALNKRLNINSSKLRKIRRYWNFLAMFSRTKKTPESHFASLAILRPGINQVDLGFLPHLASFNARHIGFLLSIEMVSERISVVPIKVGCLLL